MKSLNQPRLKVQAKEIEKLLEYYKRKYNSPKAELNDLLNHMGLTLCQLHKKVSYNILLSPTKNENRRLKMYYNL